MMFLLPKWTEIYHTYGLSQCQDQVSCLLDWVQCGSTCLAELIDLAEPRATDYYHTVIIDCGPIVFVDSMGLATIEKVGQ